MGEPIVRFEYPSAKTFLTLLKTLGNIVDEASLKFTSEGLSVKALDAAKVALIEIKLPSDAFLEYEVKDELEVGMNLSALLKVLPTPKKTDKVSFRADEEFYQMEIEGVSRRSYKFRSVEVSASEIPEISLDFKVRAIVLAQALKTNIKDLKGSEAITFRAEDNQYLYLRGFEGRAEAKLSRMAGSILEMELSEPSESTYDEDYLTKVINLMGLIDNVEIQFGTNLPLKLSFGLVEGGSVLYLLAPKA